MIFQIDKHTYLLEERSREEDGKKHIIVHVKHIRAMRSTIEVLLDNNRRRDLAVTFDLERNQIWIIEARMQQDIHWSDFPDNEWV